MAKKKKIEISPALEERIKNGKNYLLQDGKDILNIYAKLENLSVGEIFEHIIESAKKHCLYNFYGCNDRDGNRVAFGLDEMAQVLNMNKNDITCDLVNSKGCCAYINKIMYASCVEAAEKCPAILDELEKRNKDKENEDK